MNGSGETWIDLMSKDSITNRHSKNSSGSGVKITPTTPRTSTRFPSHSRLINGEQQDQVEILRSQVVGLLHEKQELVKKVQNEKLQREQIEKEMETLKSKRSNKSVCFNGENQFELQVHALREALDEVTQERNTLRDLLSRENKHQNESETDIKLRHKEIEIQGLRTQLKQLRQELNTMSQLHIANKDGAREELVSNHSSLSKQSNYESVIENLQHQLVEQDEKLSKTEKERDALRERLVTVETQRQLSMEQYQEEVETSVMAVTTQLEELLELNQQLQKELTTLQSEKEELIKVLEKQNETKDTWNNEKVHYHQQLVSYEKKVNQLKFELEQVKQELQVNNSTSQKELELKKQLECAKREQKKQSLETESIQCDLEHQQTLLEQEKQALLRKIETIQVQHTKKKSECKRLEEEINTLRTDLTNCQRDKATCEAQVLTVKTELSNAHEQCNQLKRELNEVRDVTQSHSRQQVETLTHQLVQKSQQLQKLEDDKRQLISKVKKLENKVEETTSSFENNSTKLNNDISSLMANYNVAQSQLKQIQATNVLLQEKTLALEEEVASWKKQSEAHENQLSKMKNMSELKSDKINELECTIETLNEELAELNSQREHNKGQSLLSQVQSLQESVIALQEEKESLDTKLKVEMERNKVAAQTEKRLTEENTKLQELLNSSLSLNDKLQSSFELDSSSKDNSLKHSPSQTSPQAQQQCTSPAAEILHLKQQLAEARQTCLKLEKKQVEDQTEMAKVQGSLQALVKIQEHLSGENKTLEQTFVNLEEEKELYKQEVKKLSSELNASQENIERMELLVNKFMQHVHNWLSELVKQVNPSSSELHTLLTECQQSAKEGYKLENLDIVRRLVEISSKLAVEENQKLSELRAENGILNEKVNKCNTEREDEVVQLQEKVANIYEEMNEMKKEVEEKENELEEKERELANLQLKLSEGDTSRMKSEESFKKDLDTQYQAKLAVLRGSLMDREDEISSLQSTLLELKTQLNETEVILSSTNEELSDVKDELQLKRELLVHYEDSLKNERAFLESEAEAQTNDITSMKIEMTELKETSQKTQNVNQMEENQLRACDERVIKLRGEIEMLRAKKSVFDNYLKSHETSHENISLQEKDDLLNENAQLMQENEDLKQELITLSEGTQHLQDQIDILVLRLQDIEEESDENREIEKKQLEESHRRQLEQEIQRMKMELQTAQEEFQHYYNMFEERIEAERSQLRNVEKERDILTRELSLMKLRLSSIEDKQKQEMDMLQQRINERDVVFADMHSSLEQAMADREALEIRLNESSPGDNTRKIDKLKVKLKQQVKQSNHLRMKLGYALSELRLYKQLKKELDNQVTQLQLALTQSQRQYEQCLAKLNEAEKFEPISSIASSSFSNFNSHKPF